VEVDRSGDESISKRVKLETSPSSRGITEFNKAYDDVIIMGNVNESHKRMMIKM
jgi:hypothetical protein